MGFIEPFISIGPLKIYYYGMVYAFGFFLSYWYLAKHAKKYGITKAESENLIMYLIISMVIFARIFHFAFSAPSTFIQNPFELFAVWHGGMSFYGGFLGLIIGLGLFLRKHKHAHGTKITDALAIIGSGILILGRLANFINQELVGRITDVAWCVTFETAIGCRHPYQLYAAASHVVLFLVLLFLYKRQKTTESGTLVYYFAIGYSILRFIVDFYRDDTPILLGLTIWQIISLVTLIISVVLYKKRKT
ncbi:MAG: phosphatidylglycerol:prolipoprotein diacylglycerol transferase [Candidatus Woesearchaeota archaeon]|jgi:phosphatidylglycerol:prolipoprotein diacylglycerol transferase